MKNIVNTYVERFKADHRKSRRTASLLLTLALIVAAGVFWQLHSTGIALTNETYCGLTEHQHSEDCYEDVLVCGLEESEGHTHSEDCYETQTALVCGLEESEGHTHDESCYDEEGNLVCGLEESEGHTHSEDCYETEQVLICGLEESEGHTHSEECYASQLVCELEEHTHTVECMSDETADVETSDDWEATLPTLTGVWADDVTAIAESQLGYTESTKNFTLADDGETRQGYTRYGAWAGNAYGDWDAMFASFCLYYAGISTDDFPEATGAYAWSVKLQDNELYADASEYTPAAGDIVFFDTDNDGRIDSVGIVTAIDEDNDSLTVIEGDYTNSDGVDAVMENEYASDDSTVVGFGALSESELTISTTNLTLTASDDTTDLETYIESVNDTAGHSASITLTLRTESDGDITETDDNGNTVVKTNTTYHLALTISSSAGFEQNTTYTYSLPDYVTVEAATGTIITTDGDEIGTWAVDADGTVTLAFNDNAAVVQDVEITFTTSATITTTNTSVTIGDTTYVVSEDTDLTVNKSGNYSDYTKDENDYYHGRTWEIEFSQHGVALAGTVITDYATDGVYSPLYEVPGMNISYDNQSFDTSKPLTFTVVSASTGVTEYAWTVNWSDSNLTLYTLDDQGNIKEIQYSEITADTRIIGWQYTFPNSVFATNSSGETITLDLTATDWDPYEFRITGCTNYDKIPGTDWPYRCTYYNSVTVENNVDKDYANAFTSQSYGIYDVDKDWSRGTDGNSINYTIEATIPGDHVKSYEIQDYMQIRDKSNGKIVDLQFQDYADNYVMTIEISDGTTINGTAIDAGTYTVYNIDGNVPDDALFVYYSLDSYDRSSMFFVLGMVCDCDEDYCDSWGSDCSNIIYTSTNGTKYCTCWQLNETSKVYLTYTIEADKMLELLAQYGIDANSLYNWAGLNTGTFRSTKIWLGDATGLDSEVAYVGLALAHKALSQTPSSDNDYTAGYTVTINTDNYELTKNGADLIITDNLNSTLTFLPSSLEIYATDANGNTTKLTGNDYTYTYDSDDHVITITIKNPGTNSYTITYNAQILNPAAGVSYSNSLTLSWQGTDVTVDTDTSYLSEVATTGTTYMVTILKTDKTTGAVLKGATFELYKNGDSTPISTQTTDENGQVTFSTASGIGQGSLTFETHTLYYLVEKEAPEGYQLDQTKYYFYFCDSDDNSCSDCNDMTLPSDESVSKLVDSGFFTITNAETTYGFTIKKVDANNTSTTLNGAEFYLYYQSDELDGSGNQTGNKNQYYAILDTSNAVSGWNSSTEQATKLCLTDGTFSVSGLPAGTYYLDEVTAPEGYNLLSDPIEIKISSDGSFTVTSSSASGDTNNGVTIITVKNTAGYELPLTGGTGIWMYTVIGIALCGTAGFLFFQRRKRRA